MAIRGGRLSAAFGRAARSRLVGPDDRIRWRPPAGASGSVAAFTLRVTDGSLRSEGVAQVSVDIPS
ncbi:MAG: hypothetical protein ACKOTB_17620 [Planctomycetia bacterium]